MNLQSHEKVSQRLEAQFDGWTENYDAALERGLALSGEGKEFFARGRMAWLQRRLNELGCRPETALDFGCGTGTSTPLLLELEGVKAATGVDVSEESIKVARGMQSAECRVQNVEGSVDFGLIQDNPPAEKYDLAFCNGVFHHIAPGERQAPAEYVCGSLRPGGLFAFCENNPWNPGTRLVMRRIEFDRNAVMLSAREARRLLASVGFEVLSTDFLFFFPRFLAPLRRLEPRLRAIPFGAQYMCLARKVLRTVT